MHKKGIREHDAAWVYLIGAGKLTDCDPAAYLRMGLSRIADYPVNRIAELSLEHRFGTTNRVGMSAETSKRFPGLGSGRKTRLHSRPRRCSYEPEVFEEIIH